MKNGEKALYILTSTFPEDFINDISGIGDFHIESGLIKIIDCYTNFVGVPRTESNLTYRVAGPNALSEMSIALSKAMQENPKRLVIDSASAILLHNSLNSVERFFQVLIARLRSTSATVLILVEEGVHDPKEVAIMESLTNLTITFKEQNGNKYMETSSVSGTQKIDYEIKDKKLMIKQLIEA
jgi:KaiC/GvpD/RAD55 family RecA-like ATPase